MGVHGWQDASPWIEARQCGIKETPGGSHAPLQWAGPGAKQGRQVHGAQHNGQ